MSCTQCFLVTAPFVVARRGQGERFDHSFTQVLTESIFMMGHDLRKILARVCTGSVLTAAIACNSTGPASPSNDTVNVGGSWRARIAGIQQRSSAAQTDDAILTLRQSGAGVTGVIQYSGLPTAASLSGSVSGRTFTFTAAQMLSPTCAASVESTVTVSESGNGITGSYRAVTCEDTVIGTLTATRQ
jgi:hypothetical protein